MSSTITRFGKWSKLRRHAARIAVVLAVVAPVPAHAQIKGDVAASAVGAEIALQALAYLGVPYRYGGDDPRRGFDCSGLVRYVFRNTLGLDLPRRSDEIEREGRMIELVRLEPGDLVFFDTLGRPFSHVGIYIGDGRFVHAPARRGQVRVEALGARYWAERFNGARRLGPEREPAQSAQADLRDESDTLWRGQ